MEDDLKVQSTVVELLTGLGYAVLKANDAEQALAVVASGVHIDLLFTDVVMPGVDAQSRNGSQGSPDAAGT